MYSLFLAPSGSAIRKRRVQFGNPETIRENQPIHTNLRIDSCESPKGPFRTKNATTIVKIVHYYAVVFLLRPPNLVRSGPFFERKNVCNSQESGVRTRCAAMVNHPAVLKIVRVVNLLRVLVLVQRGPLGSAEI